MNYSYPREGARPRWLKVTFPAGPLDFSVPRVAFRVHRQTVDVTRVRRRLAGCRSACAHFLLLSRSALTAVLNVKFGPTFIASTLLSHEDLLKLQTVTTPATTQVERMSTGTVRARCQLSTASSIISARMISRKITDEALAYARKAANAEPVPEQWLTLSMQVRI